MRAPSPTRCAGARGEREQSPQQCSVVCSVRMLQRARLGREQRDPCDLEPAEQGTAACTHGGHIIVPPLGRSVVVRRRFTPPGKDLHAFARICTPPGLVASLTSKGGRLISCYLSVVRFASPYAVVHDPRSLTTPRRNPRARPKSTMVNATTLPIAILLACCGAEVCVSVFTLLWCVVGSANRTPKEQCIDST